MSMGNRFLLRVSIVVAVSSASVSCNKREERTLDRISFGCTIYRYEGDVSGTTIPYERADSSSLVFTNIFYYLSEGDTISELSGISVGIPRSDSTFVYKTKITGFHSIHGFDDLKYIDEIDSGTVIGERVAADLWLIKAHTKYFNFVKYIPIKGTGFIEEYRPAVQ